MNKEKLIEIVSRKIDLPKVETKTIVDVVFRAMAEALARGDRIEIRGLGSFLVRQRSKRAGRIIGTGQTVDVPARKMPVFIPGKVIKRIVNA